MKDLTPPVRGFSPAFAALGLEARLLTTLETLGYEEPTPIQREAIPPLLAGRDLLGQAATGTGKTAAFALPLLQRIAQAGSRHPSALILVPTRELAIQVGEAVQRYGKELRVTVLPVYGGQAIGPQLHALKRGVDVIVATPGRALDHLRRRTLSLARLQVVVLDEADEMLDMGFADDLDAILEQTPAERQTALFSATMPPRIASIAHRHLKQPVEIKIARQPITAGETPRVQQTAYLVTRAHKTAALARILEMTEPQSALIFCRTRLEVDDLTVNLKDRGHRVEAIHGGMSQAQRDRVMSTFRSGRTQLLVATDVAARGLDIPSVSHVLNFDVPSAPEVYVHRIGRTGRAGRSGVAVTMVEPREQYLLRNIEHLTKSRIDRARVPGVTELRRARLDRTRAAVEAVLVAGDVGQFREVAESLAAKFEMVDVAAAAVKLAYDGLAGNQTEEEIPAVEGWNEGRHLKPRGRAQYEDRRPGGKRVAGPAGSGGRFERGRRPADMAKLYVGAGRTAGVRPGDLVGAIANEAQVSAGLIGAIEVADRFSLVDVPEQLAGGIIEALARTRIKGHKVTVRRFRE